MSSIKLEQQVKQLVKDVNRLNLMMDELCGHSLRYAARITDLEASSKLRSEPQASPKSTISLKDKSWKTAS